MPHSLMHWKDMILLQPNYLFVIRIRKSAPVIKSGIVT